MSTPRTPNPGATPCPSDPFDPFEMFDAAYVMGALDDADRAAYEQHLFTCDSCTAAIAELRGVPPLLARAQTAAAEREATVVPHMPETLLPGMMRSARQSRVRRRTFLGAAAAVAAVALVDGTLAISGNDDQSDPEGQPLAMSTASAVPLEASLRLEPKAWGTQIVMSCRYDGGDSPQWKQPIYELVVLPRGGGAAQTVARWSVLPHKDATIVGSLTCRPRRSIRCRCVRLLRSPSPSVCVVMSKHHRIRPFGAVLATAALSVSLLAACGSNDDSSPQAGGNGALLSASSSSLGSSARADGRQQLTVNGHPVYTFKGDAVTSTPAQPDAGNGY